MEAVVFSVSLLIIVLFCVSALSLSFFFQLVILIYFFRSLYFILQVYLRCANVISLYGLEMLFGLLFKEMIGGGNERPVVCCLN